MTADTPDISILNLHDEPTVLDVDLGVRLGMKQPLNIRQTIWKNIEELQGYGSIHAVRELIKAGKGAQREITEYHLTEPQALCLCQLSRKTALRQQSITCWSCGTDFDSQVPIPFVRGVSA